DWRSHGLLAAEDRGFNFLPDVTNYCAWFCADERGVPLEKGFFDYRLELYSNSVIRDYLEVRKALATGSRPATGVDSEPIDWRRLFRKHQINHVVLNPLTAESSLAGVRLLRDWEDWHLTYMDGRTTIFCWQSAGLPQAQTKPGLPRLGINTLAFGSNPE